MVNSLLPFYSFSLNKLKHTCNQFDGDEYGKVQKSRFKTLPTVNMKTIPYSELFTNSKSPLFCLLFDCFKK